MCERCANVTRSVPNSLINESEEDNKLPTSGPLRYILSALCAALTIEISKGSQRFSVMSADVSKPEEAARILSETISWNNGQTPDIVWCLAGAAKPQLFLDSTPEIMRQQMDTNYWSCLDMAFVVLESWLDETILEKKQERHLTFTSSIVAFATIVGHAPYSPTKAAIRALADSLSQEVKLYSKDIKIHTIFPGTIDSAGFVEEEKTKAEITKILESIDQVQSPELAAKKAVKGLENGEELVVVSWIGVLMRAGAWSGTPRNNWFLDTIIIWVVSIAWFFVEMDMRGTVKKYGKKNGHPSTYANRESGKEA